MPSSAKKPLQHCAVSNNPIFIKGDKRKSLPFLLIVDPLFYYMISDGSSFKNHLSETGKFL